MYVICDRFLLSKNIRFLRKRRKMSRSKFAKYVDMSGNQLFCIEKEMNDYIFLKALNNLSEIYNIPADEILSADLEEKYAGKRFHYTR